MTQTDPTAEKAQLEQAIAHLESQRALLGDAVVATALAPLRQKLAALAVPPAGERRVVTILFSDVTGSTALAAGFDPEEWAAIVKLIFREMIAPIERYGGTVARLMGDGLLAFFGAPVAHEDDPERAVLAGLGIVSGVRALRERLLAEKGIHFDVRVGINTGLAVVGAVGTDSASEYTALGDAVNLAARMEQTAAPGTVRIAAATYALVAPLFDFEPLGPVAAKGLPEPVPAFRVLGPRPGARRRRGVAGVQTQLVGRDDELARLRQVMAEVRGGRGQIVALIGEAGLGKSRLLAEAKAEWLATQPVEAGAAVWRELASTSYSGSRPYGTAQAQVQAAAGIVQEDSAAAARAKLRAMLADNPGHDALQGLYEQLLGLTAVGAEILDGETFQRGLFDAMLAGSRAELSQGPSVLVYEDMHWTDAASLALEDYLLQLVNELPVLFLVTFRPDKQSPVWAWREAVARAYAERYQEIRLQPLTIAGSGTLIDHLFVAAGLPDVVRQLVLDRSDGNPFFIEEIVRSLVDAGLLDTVDGRLRWRRGAQLADVDIPANIQALLAARIDRLAKELRRTLQLAAVIGRTFFYRVLAMISDAHSDLENQLGELQMVDLIREASLTPELTYIFRHALTQEAAYKTLLREERRAFHRRVGEALEELFPDRQAELAPLLAIHYAEAGQTLKAIHFYQMAGDSAFQLYANLEAAEHYGRALELAEGADLDGQQLAHLYQRRGRSQDLLSDHTGAIATYEAMIANADQRGDDAMKLAGLNGLATVIATVNPQFDFERSRRLGEEALALAERLGDRPALARAHWNLLLTHWYGLGDTARAVAHGEESLAIARADGLDEQEAYTLSDLGLAYGGVGAWRQGIEAFAAGRAIWRRLGNQPMLANNLSNSAITYLFVGDLDSALEVGREAQAISRTIGNTWGQISSVLLAIFVYWELGELESPWQQMTRSYEELAQVPAMIQPLAFGDGALAWIFAHLGLADFAAERYQTAVDLAETIPGVMRPWHYAILTLHDLERGALAPAVDFGGRFLSLASLDGAYSPAHVTGYLARARLSLAQGHFAQAVADFDEMLTAFAAVGVRWLVADAHYHRAQALLALDRPDEAIAGLHQGRAVAAAINSRRMLWRVNQALADLVADPVEAAARRAEAAAAFAFVADHLGSEALRAAFLQRHQTGRADET